MAARRPDALVEVTVLSGRWQDTLPGAYDPASAVVVTDPPFGLDRLGYTDDRPFHEHVVEVLDTLPAVRLLIRAPETALFDRRMPKPGRVCAEVAWRRNGTNRPNVVMHGWHAWLVYGRRRLSHRARGTTRDWCLVDPYAEGPTPVPAGSGPKHRGLTPWQAADWAVRTWVEPGRIVVDPFAGLATIGLRATAAGLDYIGAELQPDWARQAAAGLAALRGQGSLELEGL